MLVPVITAVAGVVGSAVSAMGAMAQANASAAAAEYQAQVAEQNAEATRERAYADSLSQSRTNRRRLGVVRAAYGASGMQFEGSALDLYGDQVLENELEKNRIRDAGEVRAVGYENDATLRRAEAKSYRSAGRIGAASAMIGGIGNVGTTLLRAT